MSKSKFKQRKKKKEKSNFFSKQNIMSIFIVVIMTSSVIGLMWSQSSENEQSYNGYKFSRVGNKWLTEVNKAVYEFDFLPASLEDIPVDEGLNEKISNSGMIFLTFNPNSTNLPVIDVVRLELTMKLPEVTELFGVTSAVTENINGTYDLPVITCVNASSTIPVIELMYDNETRIDIDSNCIKLIGYQPLDLLALKDRLMYQLLGIIE